MMECNSLQGMQDVDFSAASIPFALLVSGSSPMGSTFPSLTWDITPILAFGDDDDWESDDDDDDSDSDYDWDSDDFEDDEDDDIDSVGGWN